MDLTALAAAAKAARTFTADTHGRTFVLVLPTQTDFATAYAKTVAAHAVPAAVQIHIQAALLRMAIAEWNVRAGDIVPTADDEPVQCTPEAVDLLCAEREDIATALANALFEFQQKRRDLAEAARKN